MLSISLYVVLLVVVVTLARIWRNYQQSIHADRMERFEALQDIPHDLRTAAETTELRRLDAYVQFYGYEKGKPHA